MKLLVAVIASAQANSMLKRKEKILGHLDRLTEMSLEMDNKKDARHVEKVHRWVARVVDANDRNGEKCDASVDAGDDLTVFDANDAFKLNSQIMSALRSFARKYACNGRGNVSRQITRRSRRLEENFVRRKSAPETTEPPTAPPTEPPFEPVIYYKSEELMTFHEAEAYCIERGMNFAIFPKSRDSPNKAQLESFVDDLFEADPDLYAWIETPITTYCSFIKSRRLESGNIYFDGTRQCDSKYHAICAMGEYVTVSWFG